MNLPISCPVNQSTSFICGFFLIVLLENKTKAFKTLEPKSGRSTQCNGCPVEPMIFVGGGSKITGWSPMSEYPRKATPMLGSPVLSLSTVILNKPSEPTWIRSSLCPHPTPSLEHSSKGGRRSTLGLSTHTQYMHTKVKFPLFPRLNVVQAALYPNSAHTNFYLNI